MELVIKSDNWHVILSSFETYSPKKFDIKHLSTIRSTISTTIKDEHPDRVYKTKTTEEQVIVNDLPGIKEYIIVERLK